MRGAGVSNGAVVEAISGEAGAAPAVTDAFTSYVRTVLRRNTSDNQDFKSNRFQAARTHL